VFLTLRGPSELARYANAQTQIRIGVIAPEPRPSVNVVLGACLLSVNNLCVHPNENSLRFPINAELTMSLLLVVVSPFRRYLKRNPMTKLSIY
jgi:hypothetical protein